ncbi:hypothetical protein Tco_0050680, partial [Tanacetum coccineum]
PPKETVKAVPANLRLTDENDTSLSSSDLINSSQVKIKYFSPKWRDLMQYIVKCLRGMHGSYDQLNANQQTIAYCLFSGLNVDIAKPIKSLIPSFKEVNADDSGKVNADDSADKSSSRTSV